MGSCNPAIVETNRPSGANDNHPVDFKAVKSAFPADATARIFRPSWLPNSLASHKKRGWRIRFERRRAPYIEPLMGWTGSDDTLPQIELVFPSLKAAIRHAERSGLTYAVEKADRTSRRADRPGASDAFSNATLERLGLGDLQGDYADALDGAEDREDPTGCGNWRTPMDLACDPHVPLVAKRSILMNWAWEEYLLEQGTSEGMPKHGPSILAEVEHALMALEEYVSPTVEAPTKAA